MFSHLDVTEQLGASNPPRPNGKGAVELPEKATQRSFTPCARQEQEGDRSKRPLMLAQRMELEARFARYHEPQDPRLKEGVLVVEKEGLGVVGRVCGRPIVAMILWRFLNRADPVDSELAVDWARRQRINKVDCMVGVLDDEAEHVGVFPHDSAHLRPYDDATDSDEVLDREGG